jgi:hypothetical protein
MIPKPARVGSQSVVKADLIMSKTTPAIDLAVSQDIRNKIIVQLNAPGFD